MISPNSFDPITARRQVAEDEGLLREVIGLFLEDTPKQVSELRKALNAQDAALLERTAHTIKGSCVILGAHDAQKAAHTLEMLGRAKNFAEAEAASARLSGELQRLSADLGNYMKTTSP
jgi:HPt (histidine-containing phosphotransfer) domain-containing protein